MPPAYTGGPAGSYPARTARATARTTRALAAPRAARATFGAAAPGGGSFGCAIVVIIHAFGLAFALGLRHGFHGCLGAGRGLGWGLRPGLRRLETLLINL